MTTRRFLLLLSASMIAIVGAMYLSSLRHLDRDPRGQSLLPGFDRQLDAVTEIRLRKGSPTAAVTLRRAAPGRWTLAERGDYPADVAKIRKLLMELSDAKVVEEKTSNPANYAIIGVQDPSDASAEGVEVTLLAGTATHALIVGKPAAGGSFVRRGGAAQSFAVEPAITVEAGVREWIDPKLLDIAAEKIQGIRVHFADGSGYSLVRQPAANPVATAQPGPAAPPVFRLESVPSGREAADPAILAPSPSSFGGVTADDVAAAGSVDFTKSSTCEIELVDGGSYTLTGTIVADKHWLKASATKDGDLNARAQGRAFEVASYRYDAIFRPLEQLLKPKPVKPPPAAPKKTAVSR